MSTISNQFKVVFETKLLIILDYYFKLHLRDFPGGPVVKNPLYSAGDRGSIPGQGTKIPHAEGQLSPCAQLPSSHASPRARVLQTTEPPCPGACAPQLEKRKPTCHN